jgi:hypothetical protein
MQRFLAQPCEATALREVTVGIKKYDIRAVTRSNSCNEMAGEYFPRDLSVCSFSSPTPHALRDFFLK